jgi:hypothetical protein
VSLCVTKALVFVYDDDFLINHYTHTYSNGAVKCFSDHYTCRGFTADKVSVDDCAIPDGRWAKLKIPFNHKIEELKVSLLSRPGVN